MVTTILITFWLTCSLIHCVQEGVKLYSPIEFFIFDVIFAPYFLISDAISEYKDWRNNEI